jgi:hypothetical protein
MASPLENPVIQGLEMFRSSVQSLAQQRAISSLREQVDSIRSAEADEQQKHQALQQLGSQFALNALQTGMPNDDIQQALKAAIPPQPFYQTADQAVLNAPEGSAARGRGEKLIEDRQNNLLDRDAIKAEAAAERAALARAEARTKFNETQIKDFRNKVESSENYKNYTKARNSYSNVEEAIKRATSIDDIAVIFETMKALDPTSVVREGEQDLMRKARSTWASMKVAVKSIATGEKLDEGQRQNALKLLETLKGTYKQSYERGLTAVTKQAKRRGLPLEEIDPLHEEHKAAPAAQPKAGPAADDLDAFIKF